MSAKTADDADVIVVGAGMGGLAAAVCLAEAGKRVVIVERAADVGGKVGTHTHDGVTFDTGPSLLTLPDVLAGVLGRAGLTIAERDDADVVLVRPRPAFRYRFADPSWPSVDVHTEPERTLASVADALGADAGRELGAFLRYAQGIWDASKDDFVFARAPTAIDLLRLGLTRPVDMLKVDPFSSMRRAIDARISHPALRLLLLRYATYNGSDPTTAPATLNCIAHVELTLGGFGVKGGMGQLARALARAAQKLGATIVPHTDVTGLVRDGDRVTGARVKNHDGSERVLRAGAVVVNADVADLRARLMPGVARALPTPGTPSLSGATMVLRARRRTDRVAHEVLFSADYHDECADLFRRRRGPQEPTVYVCAQEPAHGVTGWAEHEPLFVMANLPAIGGAAGTSVTDDGHEVLDRARGRLLERGLIDDDDEVVWRRTSADLARQFPGSHGSLYGAASNDRASAFRRPPNAVDGVPGLFLASGSAHPGGGVPLCVQSGVLAADAVLAAR